VSQARVSAAGVSVAGLGRVCAVSLAHMWEAVRLARDPEL
jgi:hypothetical protein